MGRIKRGYVREIPSDELKRDYRLFAIACEGSKREKEYFQQLEGISSRVVVEYIEDQEYEKDPPSSPLHVLRRAIEYFVFCSCSLYAAVLPKRSRASVS